MRAARSALRRPVAWQRSDHVPAGQIRPTRTSVSGLRGGTADTARAHLRPRVEPSCARTTLRGSPWTISAFSRGAVTFWGPSRSTVRGDRPDGGALADRREAAREPGTSQSAGQGRASRRTEPRSSTRGRRSVLRRRRAGDFEALLRVLHPDVVLQSDLPRVGEQRGAARVARMALGGARQGGTPCSPWS